MCCSSMRSTGYRVSSRSCSTRRWRTSRSTSSWTRGSMPAPCGSRSAPSRWWAPPRGPECSPRRCASASGSSTTWTSTPTRSSAPSSGARLRFWAPPSSRLEPRPSRAAHGARRASPIACCGACATTRRSRATASSRARSRGVRWTQKGSTAPGSTGSIAASSRRSSSSSTAGPPGSRPLPPPSTTKPRPWPKSWRRSCSRSASWSAPPTGGRPRRPLTPTCATLRRRPPEARRSCRSSKRLPAGSSPMSELGKILVGFGLVVILAWARPAVAADDIRVALVENARTVEIGGGPMLVSDLGGQILLDETPASLRVQRNGGVEVKGRRVSGVRLVPANAGYLRFNGREYPGAVEIVAGGDGLAVINEVPFEEYLAGAVQAEAGDKMPVEMLKAQAIVARTYAAYHRQLNAGKPYHIVASNVNQHYSGRVPADSPVWTAVRDTEGQILLWDGGLFPAFYHTDSGGHTEDPRAVFASSNLPALRPVRVEFPSASPYHQ